MSAARAPPRRISEEVKDHTWEWVDRENSGESEGSFERPDVVIDDEYLSGILHTPGRRRRQEDLLARLRSCPMSDDLHGDYVYEFLKLGWYHVADYLLPYQASVPHADAIVLAAQAPLNEPWIVIRLMNKIPLAIIEPKRQELAIQIAPDCAARERMDVVNDIAKIMDDKTEIAIIRALWQGCIERKNLAICRQACNFKHSSRRSIPGDLRHDFLMIKDIFLIINTDLSLGSGGCLHFKPSDVASLLVEGEQQKEFIQELLDHEAISNEIVEQALSRLQAHDILSMNLAELNEFKRQWDERPENESKWKDGAQLIYGAAQFNVYNLPSLLMSDSIFSHLDHPKCLRIALQYCSINFLKEYLKLHPGPPLLAAKLDFSTKLMLEATGCLSRVQSLFIHDS
jgi:hypothetical protein